jgi:transposase-like protein
MAVARKMGISDSLIHAWRKANDKAGPPFRFEGW